MTFNFYDTKFAQSNNSYTPKELLMVKHGKPKNDKHWEQFDLSVIKDDDIVLLVDGDWLAFSTSSKEMERSVEFTHNGVTHNFKGCYTEFKQWCEDNNIDYQPEIGVKVQYNHPKALEFAKSSCKKKLYKAIQATKATKVIIFCGSTGNHRDSIPLPKLDDDHYYNYKGNRDDTSWIPETLKPLKEWLMTNWYSNWAVGEEADDCITIAKHALDKRSVISYIHGVDKDYNCEQIGGLYLIGHHDSPEWFGDTEDNRLGWIKAIKTEGGADKMIGHGDMFLSYQTMFADDSDGYSAKKALKELGTLKRFGYKGCEKYLMQFNTRKELWQGVVEHFNKYLPERFVYKDCFDNTVVGNPMDLLNIYYRCAKMREHKDHVPNIFEDRLIPLGVKFDK